MGNIKQEKLQELIASFFKEHSAEEVVELLYTLYRGWALQSAIKVGREERLRVLMGYDGLKEFFEEFGKNYVPETPEPKLGLKPLE